MGKFTTLLLCFTIITTVNSYKILGIFPSLDRSNYVTYRELLRELANRDNEVTLISHYQIPNAPSNLNQISLSDKQELPNGLSFESVIVNELSRLPFETLVSTKAGNDDCKTLLNNNHVSYMIKSQAKFDVVLVESYNSDCGIALASNFSAPYIAFNPQPAQPWHYDRLGINFNSAHVPQAGLPYGKDPWFFERVIGYVLYHLTNWVYYVGSQVTDRVYLYKFLGDDLPSLESLASNASLVFVNTHQSLFGGVARADNVIDVGGIHLSAPKPLPSTIQNFIDEAEHGVVYVNLGTTVRDSTFSNETLKELLDTFRSIPFRILWKWDGKELKNLPKTVLTMKWLPQYDILNHPQVKVFISHAGILSTIEAVDSGTPVIAIPLFGDQHGNAAVLSDAGVASIVSFKELKQKFLLDALNEALDSSRQTRAKLVSKLWNDRPAAPLDSAIYWIEYVTRHQGAPNLAATSALKPFYQQVQIDVLAFIFLVVYILLAVLYKLSSFCCCCCPNDTESQTDTLERRSKRVKFE